MSYIVDTKTTERTMNIIGTAIQYKWYSSYFLNIIMSYYNYGHYYMYQLMIMILKITRNYIC